MMKIHENSIMFELQTTPKNFLYVFNIHYGYLKVPLDIRLSSDIKIIVPRCIDQKLSLGSKKKKKKNLENGELKKKKFLITYFNFFY